MSALRQAVLGVLAATLSSLILMGSIFLALAESGHKLARAIPPTPVPTVNTPVPGQPTFTASPTPLPTLTPTLQATSVCSPPDGWIQVEAQPGDTIASIAQFYGISVELLRKANCDYAVNTIPSQTYLNVPGPTATPTATATSTQTPTLEPTRTPRPARNTAVSPPVCSGPPHGWVVYIVRGGDTLYSIATSHGTTVAELKYYNCLRSDLIRPGDRLYVPYVPTRTPAPSATPRPTNTPSLPTATWTSPATFTPTIVPTHTPTDPPTNTPVPTDTPTTVPTDTPTDTPTAASESSSP